MVNEALYFFENKDFHQDIADLLVQVPGDVIQVNMYIHQNKSGYIHLLKLSLSEGSKEIYIKYMHKNFTVLGNYYDAIPQRKDAEEASQQQSSNITGDAMVESLSLILHHLPFLH